MRSCFSVNDATVPWPLVVRSTVVSCMTTTWPSLVTPTSSSSMSAPTCSERLNAYIVLDGNSSSPPWWAMSSGVFSIHGFVAAPEPTRAPTASRRRRRRAARASRHRVLDRRRAPRSRCARRRRCPGSAAGRSTCPTPLGVPVRIRSPGSSVIVSRRKATISGTEKMRSLVRESWRSSPLIHVRSARSPGSAHLVGGGDPRAERARAVEALRARPLALGALQVARA